MSSCRYSALYFEVAVSCGRAVPFCATINTFMPRMSVIDTQWYWHSLVLLALTGLCVASCVDVVCAPIIVLCWKCVCDVILYQRVWFGFSDTASSLLMPRKLLRCAGAVFLSMVALSVVDFRVCLCIEPKAKDYKITSVKPKLTDDVVLGSFLSLT